MDGLSRALVVGGGTMGGGIAQLLARAGVHCTIADATPELAVRSRERAVEQAHHFHAAGLWPERDAENVAEFLRAGSLSAAARDAELVIEAIVEDPARKHEVLRAVEASAPAAAVIATNTSAIPIGLLAQALERRGRFLGWHWFNPPQWVPCVEVVPAGDTLPETVMWSLRILQALGKRPASVGDSAGFVANRIQFAMFKEAAAVVADGVADAATVDEVIRTSFGFRLPFYGPFTIADMAGLDVYTGAYAALREALGERLAAPESLEELVSAGRKGTKTGAGYREWTAADTARLLSTRDRQYAALGRLLDAEPADGGDSGGSDGDKTRR